MVTGLSDTFKYLNTCKIQVLIQPTFVWELTKDLDTLENFFPKYLEKSEYSYLFQWSELYT